MTTIFENLYKAEKTCWKTGTADKVSILIDSQNYFRAVYEAVCDAEHSIFILGWDLDGRVNLIRGKEAKEAECPINLYELIHWKAENNPDLKIYINRWNYSVFFMQDRDVFADFKWDWQFPENVHFCSDYIIPFLGSHHQKIITIDDKVAFCGGMDIGKERWDERHHHIHFPERIDEAGTLEFPEKSHQIYQPRHDIQMVLAGKATQIFSEIVRRRWRIGAGYEAIPIREPEEHESIKLPQSVNKDFTKVPFAVSRTIPKTRKRPARNEIMKSFLAEIEQAEKFIYIENQYATCEEIAQALNRQLKEKPDLRVLLVSCDYPKTKLEAKTMWVGRYEFAQTVRKDLDNPSRFIIAYPLCRENGQKQSIYIHSKLMIIDEKILRVGSANLNNRSMGMDTECDVSLFGDSAQNRNMISHIRSDLIREHTGKTVEEINDIINNNKPLKDLIRETKHSRQHLIPIYDEEYKSEKFSSIARRLGDSKVPVALLYIPSRQIVLSALAFILLLTAVWMFAGPTLSAFFTEENLTAYMQEAETSPLTPLIVMSIYIVGGLVFFPVMALNLITAIIFGPLYGMLYGFLGSLSSASVTYAIGRLIHRKTYNFFRKATDKVKDYAARGGIAGMTLIRMIPIAPYTLVNMAFGITGIPYFSYIISTAFGLAPGIVAKSILGGAIKSLWKNPEPKVIVYTIGALCLWIGMIFATNKIVKYYQKKMAQ